MKTKNIACDYYIVYYLDSFGNPIYFPYELQEKQALREGLILVGCFNIYIKNVFVNKYDSNVLVLFEEDICTHRFTGHALTSGNLPDGKVSKKNWRNYWYKKDFISLKH